MKKDDGFQFQYTPRKWARILHHAWQRHGVVIVHRRGGKTTATIQQLQRAATDNDWERWRLRTLAEYHHLPLTEAHLETLLRHRMYGHVYPTRVQAKLSVWDMLKEASLTIKGSRPNESELRVDYPGGHRVQLFGADEPDRLRGPAFSGLIFDEFGMQPPNIYSEVMSKNLADHLGFAYFVGTIKGKNQLFKTYEAAKNDQEWFAVWQDINQSLETEDDAATLMLRQAMHDDEKLIAKGLMSREEFDQEWFLSTEAAIKGSYYAKQIAQMRKDGRIRHVPYDEALPVYDVWDLGKGENMAIGIFQRVAKEVHMLEYLEGAESEGITQMVAQLQRKPYVFGKHFAPHDIAATELSTGKTRQEVAKKLGWDFTIVPNIGLDDGINALRMMFSRLWVDEEKCAGWVEAIGHYRRPWNERMQTYGDMPLHDWASHPADCARYSAVVEDQMTTDQHRRRPKATGGGAPPKGDHSLAWMG